MQNNILRKGLVLIVIALFTLTSIIPSIVGEGEVYFYANQDMPVQNGGISGDYTDTHNSDDTYEAISERESGGKPSRRYSYLEHKWTFELTGSYTSLNLHLEAYHTANDEGDDFIFAYSTDDNNYTDLLTVSKTSDNDNYQSASMPNTLTGTVYIRVVDLDRTQGRKTLDTIYIDHMYIEASSEPDVTPPIIFDVEAICQFGVSGIEILTRGSTAGTFVLWENQSGGWVEAWNSLDIGHDVMDFAVGNVDGDSDNEIVISLTGTSYPPEAAGGGYIMVWENQSGGYVNTWNSSETNYTAWAVVIGDADNDGNNEILKSASGLSKEAELFKWNGSTYERIWSGYVDTTSGLSVAIGDIDGDNDNEMLTAGIDNTIFVWEHQGGTSWSNTDNITGAGNNDQIVVGDADNDGNDEVIFCGADSKVHVVKYTTGSGYEEIWDSGDMGGFVQDCAVGDVDNDGKNEIVGGSDEMHVWEHQGGTTWDLVWNSSAYGSTGMKVINILDLDGDGLNEFTNGVGDKFYIWEHDTGDNYVKAYESDSIVASLTVGAGDPDNDAVDDPVAIITWITDEPSNSVVNYGTTTALGNTTSESTLVTNHKIILSGLLSNTTYYYEVQSTDASNNTATDNNNGSYYTFPDTTAPVISNVASTDITDATATITWTTDEPSDSVVNYGTTTALGNTTSNSNMVTSHSIMLTDLLPNTTYYFEVQSTDASDNTATDNNNGSYYTFITAEAPPINVMHVQRIDMWYEKTGINYMIYTKVWIVDSIGGDVEGATVYIEMDLPGGSTHTDNGVTGSDGTVTFSYGKTKVTGTYTSTVTNVVKDGWMYNPDDNVETSESLVAP